MKLSTIASTLAWSSLIGWSAYPGRSDSADDTLTACPTLQSDDRAPSDVTTLPSPFGIVQASIPFYKGNNTGLDPGENFSPTGLEPITRTLKNAKGYDKVEAAGKEEARKIMSDNPNLQITVLVVMIGSVMVWMLQPRSLEAEVDEYDYH